MSARRDWQAEPPRYKDSENMTVREQCHGSVHGPHPRNHPIRAFADLPGTLAIRTSVREDHPAGRLCLNPLRREPLIAAVVPFDQVVVDHRLRIEAGERACPARTLQRACEDEGELSSSKHGRE